MKLVRRAAVAIVAGVLLAAGSAWCAPAGPPRIGWLKIQDAHHTTGQLAAFRAGMAAQNLVEGRDFVIDERYADGHEARLPGLAQELIGLGDRVIVATSQPSIAAAGRVTKTVPVIGRMVDDPVATGLAQSLARPGGNITGVYTMTEAMNPKRLALLKEALPAARRVGVLLRLDFPSPQNAAHTWQAMVAAAGRLGLQLVALNAGSAAELTAALQRAAADQLDGIVTVRNPTVVTYLKPIAEQARALRLPTVFDAREYVEAGGLISYGPDIDATYRQLAVYAAKLLRGAAVGALPVEQPTRFELVINQRTAAALGVALPTDLLARADKVIE